MYERTKSSMVPPRYQQGPITTALNLGPLASLPGSWRGTGFNEIWRPDNPESQPLKVPPDPTKRFLELNLTNESFDFHVIPGVVPNRGLNRRPISACTACTICSGSATPTCPRFPLPGRHCTLNRGCS
jgi:hypothetical protein